MGGTFNPQILMEKLVKLNSSQQSIETLSHWCIFHMNKATYVVETWDRQFHSSPREQRLSFLYLANDILQNSRRKGSEFVGEFWKVLPDALRDVMESGDELEKHAARRLIVIWNERKVFGSRGQILKEEFIGRQLDNSNKNGKHSEYKLKPSLGNTWENLVSGYQHLHGRELDEDVLLNNCRIAITSIEKIEKEIAADTSSEKTGYVEELQGQHAILRDCIEQLLAVEASRASFATNLREALNEQEFKLDQVRNQLQAANSQLQQAGNINELFVKGNNVQPLVEQNLKETSAAAKVPRTFMGREEQSAPVTHTKQSLLSEKSNPIEEDNRKSTAAAVAAKLTASTSSAQMLSYVLSSLASGGANNSMNEPSGDYPPEKRAKLDTDQSSYQPSPPPPPPSSPPPPMPPLPPPMQPYPLQQFMHTSGSMSGVPYNYGMTQQLPPPPPPPLAIPGYPHTGAPMTGMSPFIAPSNNPYQRFQGPEGGFYTQQPSLPMAPQ